MQEEPGGEGGEEGAGRGEGSGEEGERGGEGGAGKGGDGEKQWGASNGSEETTQVVFREAQSHDLNACAPQILR